jgi:hypothetical protein
MAAHREAKRRPRDPGDAVEERVDRVDQALHARIILAPAP